jgi:toxic protein SymE
MAGKNSKPEVTITKIVSDAFPDNSEKHEEVRKNNVCRLLKKCNCSADKNNPISKPLRRMNVSYVSIRHYDRQTNRTRRYTRSASLRLNGLWMEAAGFTSGTPLDVRVMPGCLVITTRPVETPFMKALNNISLLPEKEQQQVMLFLQGVAAKVALEAS